MRSIMASLAWNPAMRAARAAKAARKAELKATPRTHFWPDSSAPCSMCSCRCSVGTSISSGMGKSFRGDLNAGLNYSAGDGLSSGPQNKKGDGLESPSPFGNQRRRLSGLLAGLSFDQFLGVGLDVPDQADPGKRLQDIVGHVDFPPVDALGLGIRELVVVVVPPFPHGDHRQDEVVFAVIPGLEPLAPENMGQGVDGEGAVVKKGGGGEEAPGEHLQAVGVELRRGVLKEGTEEKDEGRQDEGRQAVVLVEEPEFRVLGQVLHRFFVGGGVTLANHPSPMGPPETPQAGGVDVLLRVRILVVVAVMGGPPERSLLAAG